MRHDIQVTTPDGACSAVVVTPDDDGSWPAVIVFMDAGGVRPAMIDIAQRLADMGYVAFLPDMYHRHGHVEPFDMNTVRADPAEMQRLISMVMSITPDMVTSDTGAFLEYLAGAPFVSDAPVGATGYCMGGKMALGVAGHFPDRVVAAASFHGGQLVTDAPDSPHRLVHRITGRVYVAGAHHDGSYTEADAETLAAALRDAGVDHRVEMYPAEHGFAVPDNPTYDVDAAERHWRALDELFAATLAGDR